MRRGWQGGLVVGLLMSALVARGEEYWLKYRFAPKMENEIVNMGGQSLQLNKGLPQDWTAPEGAVDPVSGVIKMAGNGTENHFRIVFAKSKAGLANRDRLWVSRDGNWSKGAVFNQNPRTSQYQTDFGPVPLKLNQPDGPLDYHVKIILQESTTGSSAYAQVSPAGYYEDWIELEGKKRHVALVDANCNGSFTDVAPSLYQSDWLMVDLNDDGRLDAYGPSYKEVFTVGKFAQFDKKLYRLTVAADGASFTLEEPQTALGTIQAPQQEFKLVLFGDNGRLAINGKNGEAQAPAGKYQFVQASIFAPGATDQNGWRMESQPTENKKIEVTVAEGKPAKLNFGPPLTATVSDQPGAGGEHTFTLKIAGPLGEEYRINNGNNNPPSKLKVQREGAKEEARVYDFAYG